MDTPINGFGFRQGAVPRAGGFRIEGYWVWCGSVVRDDRGQYHMFASRWPQSLAFHPHWLTNSEIVRAVSDRAEGPYEFQEVVLPAREKDFWDGRMTHNPTIHKSGRTYVLFYTGTTYDLPVPTPERPAVDFEPVIVQAHANQRIGVATAPSPEGPWTRLDHPVLEPRPGQWDGLMTTNPAPCLLEDGRVLLVYKSVARRGDLLRLGVAMGERVEGPYRRLSDEPILRFDQTGDHVEDPCLWRSGEGYEIIMKDMAGGLGGERYGGVHARSTDGVHWQLSTPPQAYSRTLKWDDETCGTLTYLERPQLLFDNARPTHLFAAFGEADGFDAPMKRSWCGCVPLIPR